MKERKGLPKLLEWIEFMEWENMTYGKALERRQNKTNE